MAKRGAGSSDKASMGTGRGSEMSYHSHQHRSEEGPGSMRVMWMQQETVPTQDAVNKYI